MLADLGSQGKHLLDGGVLLQCPLAGTLDYGAVGDGIAEWNSQLDDRRACIDGGKDDVARAGEVGIAAGYVGD